MIKHTPPALRFSRLHGSTTISLRILGHLLLIAGLLPFTGCSKPPARTDLDFFVQGGRLEQTAKTKDSPNSLIFGGRVIGTKVLSVEGEVITQQWHVKQGNREASYIVKLTPVPGGGTHIQVTSP